MIPITKPKRQLSKEDFFETIKFNMQEKTKSSYQNWNKNKSCNKNLNFADLFSDVRTKSDKVHLEQGFESYGDKIFFIQIIINKY